LCESNKTNGMDQFLTICASRFGVCSPVQPTNDTTMDGNFKFEFELLLKAPSTLESNDTEDENNARHVILLEEFVTFLIHVLTHRSIYPYYAKDAKTTTPENPAVVPISLIIRRHLVHTLAIKELSHSLVSLIDP